MTWQPQMYSWRNRKSNCSLIAPRELAIEALEERFTKWKEIPKKWCGELGRHNVEKWLGVKLQKSVEWYSTVGIIQLNHDEGTEERQKMHWKDFGPVRAMEIPYWGKSVDLIQNFK